MKDFFNFDIGEININKKTADELRENILLIARQNNIGVHPIQYELLLKNIKARMSELSREIDFTFNGSGVDFNIDNPVIFTTRVLKSFFSEKIESEIITIQIKNLDILSFYAYGKPWTKNIVSYNTVHQNKIDNESDSILNNNKNHERKRYLKYFIPLCFLCCALIISTLIYLLLKEYKRNNDYKDDFQSIVEKLYNPVYYTYYGFDNKNYDTLIIPPKSNIFSVNFNDIESALNSLNYYYVDGIKLEQIFEEDTFDIKPGIKYCNSFGKMAYGFGRTYRHNDCYTRNVSYNKQKYMCILRVTFKDSTFVSYISFNWVEIGGNWGSTGHVHINREPNFLGTDPYQTIGIYPNSNKMKDEVWRPFRCKVDRYVKFIDIAVWDISDESEIFLNDLILFGK